MTRPRDLLLTHNERVKLFAGFLNAVGLGLIGFAVLKPVTENIQLANLATLWWGTGGLVMHAFSHYILGYLRKDGPT